MAYKKHLKAIHSSWFQPSVLNLYSVPSHIVLIPDEMIHKHPKMSFGINKGSWAIKECVWKAALEGTNHHQILGMSQVGFP